MRFPLRVKFFVFATLLAIAPLALVGENLTRLTRDELKSAANEDLTLVADELSNAFDNTWRGRWLSALLVIRNGIDSDELGVQQKVSLLTLGLQELPQVLLVYHEGRHSFSHCICLADKTCTSGDANSRNCRL